MPNSHNQFCAGQLGLDLAASGPQQGQTYKTIDSGDGLRLNEGHKERKVSSQNNLRAEVPEKKLKKQSMIF